MKYLIKAAQEYGLNRIAEIALENENVHGIQVDVDPLWMYFYHNRQLWESKYMDDYYYRRYYNYEQFLERTPFPPIPTTMGAIDIFWRPEKWADFVSQSNIIVNILLRPGSKPIEINNIDTPLTVRQVFAPVPRLSTSAKEIIRPLQGGISIGHSTNFPGTLGGILHDKQNNSFAVTCGHVINNFQQVHQPSLVDHSGSSLIGQCVYSKVPSSTNGQLCNPRNNSILLNDMDVALIKVDGSITADKSIINVGKIEGITQANQLFPGLLVEMQGRTSGYKNLVLGGIGFVQEIIDSDGNKCCFKNLVQVKHTSFFKLMTSRPVQGGDSGSWLVSQGPAGNEWCGMVVSADRLSGYALMSEDIIDHFSNNGFPNLSG